MNNNMPGTTWATISYRDFNVRRGRVFCCAPEPEVADFLRSRRIEDIVDRTGSFRFVLEDKELVLEHTNGAVRRFPARDTLFHKVMRWFHIPAGPISRMESQTVVNLANSILKLIYKPVRVRIEEGDALTITSERYSGIDDLTVLEKSAGYKQTVVTRSDEFMRIYFEERHRTEPVVGDVCGLGFNVLNSETGFMSLCVTGYVLRYVCKNGAVAPLDSIRSGGLVHYDQPAGHLEDYLEHNFRLLSTWVAAMSRRLNNAPHQPGLPRATIINALREILGHHRASEFTQGLGESSSMSLYDQFNYITREAQQFDSEPLVRFRLESYAGTLLGGPANRAGSE